jgi:hypothetical protein
LTAVLPFRSRRSMSRAAPSSRRVSAMGEPEARGWVGTLPSQRSFHSP